MSDGDKESIDDRLKEAEIKRVISETEKNEIEKLKIELERKELDEKLNRPWHKPHRPIRTIIQAVVAGLVGWFFVQQIVVPVSKMENYELIDKINAAKKANTTTEDSLQTVSTKLDSIQKKLEEKEQFFAERTNEFQETVNRLSEELKRRTTVGQTAQQIEETTVTIDSLTIRATISAGFGSLDSPGYANVLKQYNMITANNYYDKRLNSDGAGIENDFKVQVVEEDTVIYDAATRLTWQGGGEFPPMTWKDAKDYVSSLSYAGFNDWRLPTLGEAMSLMEPTPQDQERESMFVNPLFNDTPFIWTSEKYSASRAWVVGFFFGSCNYIGIGYDSFHVRAVR